MAIRHWQNLIYSKCPDCNTRMTKELKGFKCNECGFFLTRQTMANILTDPTHAAIRFMTPHEKEILLKGFEEIGVKQNIWQDQQRTNYGARP